jgi:two-component system LytT family response regulator
LIADDQLLAREVLHRWLKREPDVEVVGVCANGGEAVAAVNRLQPDLVFLDVEMPELDGFDVVARMDSAQRPAIVFVTSNQEFALKAFEVQAADYLLKSCTHDRFRLALQRARDQVVRNQEREKQRRLDALEEVSVTGPERAERLVIKANGRILFLRLADVDWVEVGDAGLEVHLGQETHLLHENPAALEAKLPADRFVRISSSTFVNVDQVRELHPLAHGEYGVVLRHGTRLTLAADHQHHLSRLGVG